MGCCMSPQPEADCAIVVCVNCGTVIDDTAIDTRRTEADALPGSGGGGPGFRGLRYAPQAVRSRIGLGRRPDSSDADAAADAAAAMSARTRSLVRAAEAALHLPNTAGVAAQLYADYARAGGFEAAPASSDGSRGGSSGGDSLRHRAAAAACLLYAARSLGLATSHAALARFFAIPDSHAALVLLRLNDLRRLVKPLPFVPSSAASAFLESGLSVLLANISHSDTTRLDSKRTIIRHATLLLNLADANLLSVDKHQAPLAAAALLLAFSAQRASVPPKPLIVRLVAGMECCESTTVKRCRDLGHLVRKHLDRIPWYPKNYLGPPNTILGKLFYSKLLNVLVDLVDDEEKKSKASSNA
ncbi:hypothetical protein HK100_001983 [Physocladia obscura]|uniref:Uncharacterized protein n=1 Tax=Physocladia obscura TaxID=109957 RepID=A0AAD5T906_9FUNG|nr:hypothetical protein HK100_001983 [Physocladia obscura]